ncbi:hypothetical protein [Bremerella sp.]|uniref:hypothetical protein n=1 Tax=Bremerella sp. TaxID=2795602 RepID=UPI00391B3062
MPIDEEAGFAESQKRTLTDLKAEFGKLWDVSVKAFMFRPENMEQFDPKKDGSPENARLITVERFGPPKFEEIRPDQYAKIIFVLESVDERTDLIIDRLFKEAGNCIGTWAKFFGISEATINLKSSRGRWLGVLFELVKSEQHFIPHEYREVCLKSKSIIPLQRKLSWAKSASEQEELENEIAELASLGYRATLPNVASVSCYAIDILTAKQEPRGISQSNPCSEDGNKRKGKAGRKLHPETLKKREQLYRKWLEFRDDMQKRDKRAFKEEFCNWAVSNLSGFEDDSPSNLVQMIGAHEKHLSRQTNRDDS